MAARAAAARDTTTVFETTLTARRGDVAFQHFYLIHRSGDNRRQDRVRYMIIARFSDHLSDDFQPISWT